MENYFKQNREKEPWQIAAARYCVNNSEKGINKDDLKKYIKSLYSSIDDNFIEFFFSEEICQPTGRQYIRGHITSTWTPPLDLVSKITDYDELREARKNARQAFWLSIIAIIIATITLFVSMVK